MPTVYSPPVSTYVALATTTASGGETSITFSSIPATYRDLVLVSYHQTSSDGPCLVRFNSDTGSNYTRVSMLGDGSNDFSETSTTTGIRVSQTGVDIDNTIIMQIMDYSATDKHTTTLNRWSRPELYVFADAARWANTSAINTVAIVPTGSFNAGSTFSLFGIAS